MHIVRIGGFHTLSCFIAAIGKLWGDGGLRDLLVDSDVYAGSTADLMLAGKQFHRAVRGLTLLCEALSQLLLSVIWVVIRFKDTDVLVLAIHYHPQIKMSKSCGLNVEQQQQLRIHIDLFLYMKCAKRCLQHFARFFPLYTFFDGMWFHFVLFGNWQEASLRIILKTKG